MINKFTGTKFWRLLSMPTLALLATTLVAPVQNADAARYKRLKIGAWEGGVYTNDKTGEFSHCAVSAEYKSGITLYFSVTRSYNWQVGFSKNSWNLDVGSQYPVQYQVDRRKILNGTARAASNKLAIIKLPATSGLFNQMRRGRVLRIKAGNDLLSFNLTGTNRMLTKLLSCTRRYSKLRVNRPFAATGNSGGSNSSNPFESSKPQRRVPSNNNAPTRRVAGISAAIRDEAIDWYNENLATSDESYRVIKNEGSARKMYKRHAIIWRVGVKTGIVGTLRIFPKSNPEKMENNVLASEARKCKGDFASKFLKDDVTTSRRVSRLLTTCLENSGKQWNVYYAIAKRDAGGTYLVTLLSNKATADAVLQSGERISGAMQMTSGRESAATSEEDDLPIREDENGVVRY